MKWIAIIVVVAIIVVGILIGLGIQRIKNRTAEELEHVRGLKNLYVDQINVATKELRTIRDLGGDSALAASVALDDIDRLREKHYTNQEREISQ